MHSGQCDAILRPLRSCQRGFDTGQIKFHNAAVINLTLCWNAKQALCLEVGFERIQLVSGASGVAHEIDGDIVNREESHGGAIFGSHVGDGGAVRQHECCRAGAEEFDELADHFVAAQ